MIACCIEKCLLDEGRPVDSRHFAKNTVEQLFPVEHLTEGDAKEVRKILLGRTDPEVDSSLNLIVAQRKSIGPINLHYNEDKLTMSLG